MPKKVYKINVSGSRHRTVSNDETASSIVALKGKEVEARGNFNLPSTEQNSLEEVVVTEKTCSLEQHLDNDVIPGTKTLSFVTCSCYS